MKRLLLAAGSAVLVAGCLLGVRSYVFAAHSKGTVSRPQAQKIPPLSVRILSPTKPFTVAQDQTFKVTFAITGMYMDPDPKKFGGPSFPHDGHFHIYVDCIPDGAYSKALLIVPACWYGPTLPPGLAPFAKPDTVVYAKVTQPINFKTLGMVPPPARPTRVPVPRGHHLLIIALSQNSHVLWKAPAAVLPFTIK